MFSLADIHQSSCHPSSYVFADLAIFLGSSSTNSSSQKGGNVPPLQLRVNILNLLSNSQVKTET